MDRPLHELLPPEPGRGFARLPAPSPGDVFFDIEGDPYWGEEGLEYLLGSATLDGEGGTPAYKALWAHDRAQERAAFEEWVDWITARLAREPDLHVYHYNHYEPTAIKKLMARYGTREAEVDDLLRRDVFVDLYTVVRQAMRIGTESYSLKDVEAMYPLERDADGHRRGRLDPRLPAVAGDPRRPPAGGDPGLQRRRLPVDARPARLAAGRARRDRRGWRPSRPRRSATPSASGWPRRTASRPRC